MPKRSASPDVPPPTVEIDGGRLRRERGLKGHTLEEFADLVEISFGYLGQLERGERNSVSPPIFARLCDALGIHPNRRAVLTKKRRPLPKPDATKEVAA